MFFLSFHGARRIAIIIIHRPFDAACQRARDSCEKSIAGIRAVSNGSINCDPYIARLCTCTRVNACSIIALESLINPRHVNHASLINHEKSRLIAATNESLIARNSFRVLSFRARHHLILLRTVRGLISLYIDRVNYFRLKILRSA